MRDAVAIQSRAHLLMQERGQIRELSVSVGKCRHAFIGAPVFNRRRDQLAILIAIDQRGSNQIGSARAGGIVTVAKSASLLELLFAALYCFGIGRSGVGGKSEQNRDQ